MRKARAWKRVAELRSRPITVRCIRQRLTSAKVTIGYRSWLTCPGSSRRTSKIDLRDSTLTLSGRVDSGVGQGETGIINEYESGTYFRQFTLSEMIDQAKIDAKLEGGVLHLDLPKLERAKPRQISVRSS